MAEIKQKTHGEQINDLLAQAEPMIDQLNNLYKMYSTGLERLPPTARRGQLAALIARLQAIPRPNPTYGFRISAFVMRYNSMKDKWDRLLRDVEMGKVKPLVNVKGPRK